MGNTRIDNYVTDAVAEQSNSFVKDTNSTIQIPNVYTKSTTTTLTGSNAWKQIGSTAVDVGFNAAEAGLIVAVVSGTTVTTGQGGALVAVAAAEKLVESTAKVAYGLALVVSSIVYTISGGGFDYTVTTLTNSNGNSNKLVDKLINLPTVSPIKNKLR
ncbi:MAG: hypothetical protein VB106_09095 [Clostridiaceae bacterium]|nr:hypothetical protein [Clostridiaceae bacterium]